MSSVFFVSSSSILTPSLIFLSDIAIAYNSGLCEDVSSWMPTIGALVSHKIPCVFTSFNQIEAQHDVEAIRRKAGVRPIRPPSSPPFLPFLSPLLWREDKR